jgi:hypothetical protein
LLGLAAAPILAHRVPPEAIVSELNASRSRADWGVERAERDPKAPRLLVIRVGERWYTRTAAARRARAAAWHDAWRHAVPQGVVSILDARSDTPVVHFGRGGVVSSVHDRGVAPP